MASVRLDAIPIIHCDSKPHQAFSAQITDTQKSQHTSVAVSVLLDIESIVAQADCLTDPREYCIQTKEFIADEDGKLQGLKTGKWLH